MKKVILKKLINIKLHYYNVFGITTIDNLINLIKKFYSLTTEEEFIKFMQQKFTKEFRVIYSQRTNTKNLLCKEEV